MAEKCVVKLIFETDKKPVASYWCRYDDGTSLEGHGEKVTGLVIDTIERLTKDGLTSVNKLPHIDFN